MKSLALLLALATTAAAGPGHDLAAKLDAAQAGTAYIRLTLTVQDPPGTLVQSLQIQIKEQHAPGSASVLHQVLYPKERKGEAVLLTRAGAAAPPTGQHLAPDGKITKLSSADLQGGLFGSDLAYLDTIEDIYSWKSQEIVGQEEVDNHTCLVLESKPGSGQNTPYGSVKSWVDPDRLVPLRVDKYDTGGRIVRRIDITRVHRKLNGSHIPANFMVRRPGGTSITELQGSRSKTDITYPPGTFTPEKMADLKPPRG